VDYGVLTGLMFAPSQRRNEAEKGGTELLREKPKSPNNVTSISFNTANFLLKETRFDNGSAKLASCHGCHLTSLRPCSFGNNVLIIE